MATSGPDILRGSDGADRIDGAGGADVIFGFDGGRTSPRVGAIVAERVAGGLEGAVFAGAAPGRPGELFVVRKDAGAIVLLDPATGRRERFLDIPDEELGTGGEEGLLGLAFHPDYASNGRFFVHLANADGDIEIREYARSAGDANRADPEPVRTVLSVPHPTFSNHNGGALAFGPNDGHLYIALGDGGGRNDPGGNAQDTGSLLGKVLRIDVDGDDFPGNDARNYAVPDDNPFVGAPGADEIWAYGLRNPWRISFDGAGGLYIADVGQGAREELNFQPADGAGGANYGWDLAEGSLGNPPPGAVPPIFEYGRALGASIIGGHVYRGDEASLRGAYVFADFVSGAIWTLTVEDGAAAGVTLRTTQVTGPDGPPRQITSFGVGGDGSLYAVSLAGDIFRLEASAHAGDLGDRLYGGGGPDRLYGGPGDDRLFGGGHDDRLYGGFGEDALRGGGGRDRIDGHAGGDRLVGSGGDDRLRGGGGDDALYGGRGRDRLEGGPGADRLIGGVGADRFVFDAAPTRGANADEILDLAPGVDRILLARAGFADLGASLSRREFFVGTDDGEDARILYSPADGSLTYFADGDGAGRLFARVEPDLDLRAGDFLMV